MVSNNDSLNETLKASEWPRLNGWKNQLAYLMPRVHIRSEVDLTTLTLQKLGLTSLRLERPFHQGYCTKSQRLQTFESTSTFSTPQAELLTDSGYYEDVFNPGTIKCFWCQYSFRVETQDLKLLDTMHPNDCAFFSMYLKHAEAQSAGNHKIGAKNNCVEEFSQWLVVDCGHLHYLSFDSFPGCFMANSRVPGTLCCPYCKGKITMVHFK